MPSWATTNSENGLTSDDREWHLDADFDAAPPDDPGSDSESPAATEPRTRMPRRFGPRWNRLRDRWVPEPLQHVRLDPGRRGSIALSLVAAIAAVIAAIGVWSGPSSTATVQPFALNAPLAEVNASPSTTSTVTAAEPATIVVAVTGAVKLPGVFTLPAGSRVADAIAAAGGVVDTADYTGLNLAAKLSDGDSVVVGGATQGVQSGGDSGGSGDGASGALVNLNTADEPALETLPGVGPVMASNILAWRKANGPFTSVDQLQEITGIGPSRFATLAPLVTI